jgi:hypothetical protein
MTDWTVAVSSSAPVTVAGAEPHSDGSQPKIAIAISNPKRTPRPSASADGL